MAFGRSLLRMKLGAGGGGRPGLPAHVVGGQSGADADFLVAMSTVDGVEFGSGRRRSRFIGPAGEQRGKTAGGNRNSQHD